MKINLDPEMKVHCPVCIRVYCTIVLPSDYIIHFVYSYTNIQFINLSNKVIKLGVHILAHEAAV